MDKLQHSYEQIRSQTKPVVLISGATGAGKSSLINAVFGRQIAVTGAGVPITQNFNKYESDDTHMILYDSKGLEHGVSDFVASLFIRFFLLFFLFY